MDSAAGQIVLVVEDDASSSGRSEACWDARASHRWWPQRSPVRSQAAEQHSLNAVILDLLLDGNESGVDFLAWLRQQSPYQRTPVLIYTGRTMLEGDAEQLILRYCAHVFYKPHPITLLVEYLKRLTAAPPNGHQLHRSRSTL